MISELLRESQLYKSILADKNENVLSHAYLILGEDLETRKVFIEEIALLMLCENGGCRKCSGCSKVFNESHFDMLHLNQDGKIKTGDLTQLFDFAYIKPVEASRKVVFIDNAETLSDNIQNKLLKIYEEPPKNVIIFMLASGESGILRTIKSRAKMLFLPLFSTKQIRDELVARGIGSDSALSAAIISGGRFDRALLFSTKENHYQMFNDCVNLWLNVRRSSDMAQYLNNYLFSRDSIETMLDYSQIIFKDVMIYVSGGKAEYVTIEMEESIKDIAYGFSAGGVALAIISIANAKMMLGSNVSSRQVAENLILQILEDKYDARK